MHFIIVNIESQIIVLPLRSSVQKYFAIEYKYKGLSDCVKGGKMLSEEECTLSG